MPPKRRCYASTTGFAVTPYRARYVGGILDFSRSEAMIEKTTRIISENLARAVDRRTFLRRAGEATFAGVAALAAGRMTPAFAAGRTPPLPLVPRCAPPGPYCNLNGVNEPNGCHGGSCFQHLTGGQVRQCRVYYQW